MNSERGPTKLRSVIVRAVVAILSAAIVVALATAANFLTVASRPVSLMLEPLSMLLMPGLLVSLVIAGPHDFSPNIVLLISLAFYASVINAAIGWVAERRSRRVRALFPRL